jgi:pimeloyl-ACP methyl ester carboxylesterase
MLALLAAGLLTCLLAACGGGGGGGSHTGTPGTLLNTTVLSQVSVGLLRDILAEDIPAMAALPPAERAALTAEVQQSVRLVAFEYLTTGPAGDTRTASALAMLPAAPTAAAATVAYLHGTSTRRDDIPSAGDYGENVPVAALFAARGRLVVLPDYLGLGRSDLPYHPYLHRDSLAAAGRDALIAAVELARRQSLALDGQLFVVGYSEGGFAAGALQRRLSQAPLATLALRGTMSIAGPLDLPEAVRITLSTEPATGRDSGRSIYTAFTAWAYQRVYGDVYARPGDFFESAWADSLDALFDGTKGADVIGAALPPSPLALVRPGVRAAVLDGSHPVATRVLANDVIDLNPPAPLISCHGTDDDTVPFAVTRAAQARMAARGAVLTVVGPRGAGLRGGPGRGPAHDTAYDTCLVRAAQVFR